ncbi:MAG: hypothetical protein ABIW76_20295 [Fibrobacteria bacterium]
MDSKISPQINPDPFKKKDADSASKSKEIFVHKHGVGGRARPAVQADAEPLGEEQTPLEPPKEEQQKKPIVRLFNPRWAVAKGVFGEKAKFSVEAELPAESQHLTRITFKLFAKLPDGKKERIDGNEGHLTDGKAEQEFTLYPPNAVQNGKKPQQCPYVFTAKHRDSAEIESPALAVEKPKCNDTPDPAPEGDLGKCPYYIWRNENFKIRHRGCDLSPPAYYMGYGYKYCVRFGTETAPKLSPAGKAWLADARYLLQKTIEKRLPLNPEMELDSAAFKTFAFETHPEAYWDAGLGNLPLTDLIIIGFTPDFKEWMDPETRSQAYDIGGRMVEMYRHELDDAMRKRTDAVVEYFKDILK